MKDFIMIHLNKEIKYGTIESNNIKEDETIYIYPKMNSGLNKKEDNKFDKIKFSTIDEVIDEVKKLNQPFKYLPSQISNFGFIYYNLI